MGEEMQAGIGKRVLTLWVAAAVIAMGGLATAEPSSQAGDDPIAAKVNGRPIYLKQFKYNVDQALAKSRKYSSDGSLEAVRKRIQRSELERQVDLELMAQAGEKVLPAADVEKKVEERLTAQQPAAAKEKHVADEELRQKVRRLVLADAYLAKRGLKELQVPETEQRAYYEQNKESFREGETVKVSHVLIGLAKVPKPGELETAREKIEMIREELKKGKDFAELAKQYSTCVTAKDGGSLGDLNKGYMGRDFDKVAFNLKPGEVSDVVKTKYGFHLIKAFDKKPSHIQDFAVAKALIERFLLGNVQAKWMEDIAKELRQEARIEISLE